MSKKEIEELRLKYLKNPPEGISKREIKKLTQTKTIKTKKEKKSKKQKNATPKED